MLWMRITVHEQISHAYSWLTMYHPLYHYWYHSGHRHSSLTRTRRLLFQRYYRKGTPTSAQAKRKYLSFINDCRTHPSNGSSHSCEIANGCAISLQTNLFAVDLSLHAVIKLQRVMCANSSALHAHVPRHIVAHLASASKYISHPTHI